MGRAQYLIIKLNPSYLAFISGIMVSAAINLLTTLAAAEIRQNPCDRVLAGSLLLLIASIVFMITSWNLEESFSRWRAFKRGELKDLWPTQQETLQVIAGGKAPLCWCLLAVGLLLFLFALLVLEV